MTMKAERVFLIIMLVMIVVLLSGCAWFGTANPHSEGLVLPPNTIDVETPTTVEDVRG